MWFDEVKNVSVSPNKIPDIYSEIRALNLPITVYGAGLMAKKVTQALNKHGIEVDNYAVDEEYFTPDKIYLGKPVKSINYTAFSERGVSTSLVLTHPAMMIKMKNPQ